jgi:hypothetical protein
MIIFFILIIIFILIFAYEMWRAPLLKENEDGSYTTIKPAKTWRDLFKNSPHDDIYS